jgi:hypothetical protein
LGRAGRWAEQRSGLLLGRLKDPRFPVETVGGVRVIVPPMVEIAAAEAAVGATLRDLGLEGAADVVVGGSSAGVAAIDLAVNPNGLALYVLSPWALAVVDLRAPWASAPLVNVTAAAQDGTNFLGVAVAVFAAAKARGLGLNCAVRLARHAVRAGLLVKRRLRQPLHGRSSHRLGNRLSVEIVALALRQQEDVFMRLRAAVAHALGHRVWLVPDDVLPQTPAISLKRQSDAPRNADQVFRLEACAGRDGTRP